MDAQHGWLTGSEGGLWRTTDGGATWQPLSNPEGVSLTCLAVDPSGGLFGLAPLWKGRVLMIDSQGCRAVDIPLEGSMPARDVVDAGWAYVLGADGQIARYVNPLIPAAR